MHPPCRYISTAEARPVSLTLFRTNADQAKTSRSGKSNPRTSCPVHFALERCSKVSVKPEKRTRSRRVCRVRIIQGGSGRLVTTPSGLIPRCPKWKPRYAGDCWYLPPSPSKKMYRAFPCGFPFKGFSKSNSQGTQCSSWGRNPLPWRSFENQPCPLASGGSRKEHTNLTRAPFWNHPFLWAPSGNPAFGG